MSKSIKAAKTLRRMAKLYKERGKLYGHNYAKVGPVMVALHPNGIILETEADHEFFHLYSLLIVKLTRFATSNCTHHDSIKDLCVYGAMLTAILERNQK